MVFIYENENCIFFPNHFGKQRFFSMDLIGFFEWRGEVDGLFGLGLGSTLAIGSQPGVVLIVPFTTMSISHQASQRCHRSLLSAVMQHLA